VRDASRRVEKSVADTQQRTLLELTRLSDIPIVDAFHEKEMLEKGEGERKLNPSHSSAPVMVSPDVRRKRIIEVYKRCFDESDKLKRDKVIRAFAAHFPWLVFDANWLKELVWTQFALPGYADDRKKEILLALANGFRGAASNKRRQPAIQKHYRLHAARCVQRTFCDELTKWNVGLKRPVSTPAWIAEHAASKADELANTYRQLRRGDKLRLTTLLQQGQCYKASVLVASKVFGVRVRDLQQKPD
jgi:hypothetical protein